MNARAPIPIDDPVEEAIRSLRTYPDAALIRFVRAAAYELIRRDLPLPAAVPVVEAAYAGLGSPEVLSS